jgi:hypothetical protein
MKLRTRRDVVISGRSPYPEGEWDRWFAWYPVTVATSKYSAHWVWLAFVERKWSTSIYGTERKNGAIDCRKVQSRMFASDCTI